MANGDVHLPLGAAAGVAGCAASLTVGAITGVMSTGPATAVGLLGASAAIGAVFGLLPDIDTRGRLSRSMGIVGRVITWAVRGFSRSTHGRAHRGLTHSWGFILAASLLLAFLHPALAAAAFCAAASHRLADAPWFPRLGSARRPPRPRAPKRRELLP